MNVFRASCGSCVHNRAPICELCHEYITNALSDGKCAFEPVDFVKGKIYQISPKDSEIIQAISDGKDGGQIFKEIATKYICENTIVYWNVINGKLYLTAKIKEI